MGTEPPEPASNPSSGWLPGVFLGAIDGIALLEVGVVGLALTIVTLLLIAWKGPGLVAAAGLVTGAGLIWTVVFGRVLLTCVLATPLPGEDCDAPGIAPWVSVAAAILVLGIAASAVAIGRRRRRP